MKTIWWRFLFLSSTLGGGSLVSAAEVDPAALQALQNQIKTLTEEVEKLKEGPPRNEAGEELLDRLDRKIPAGGRRYPAAPSRTRSEPK